MNKQSKTEEVPLILRDQTKYTPVRVIGQGSYGQVWLAKDNQNLGAPVAIKVFTGVNQSLKVAQAVATELSILRQLSKVRHPRIAQVFDFLTMRSKDEKEALYAVVMEYVPHTLEDYLRHRVTYLTGDFVH